VARTFLTGALLAVAGALAVLLSEWLHLGLWIALFGAGIGAVLGLVPNRSPLARLLAFLLGLVVAWLGYALRAGVLPDSVTGRMIAVVVVIALITVVCALAGGRLPFWAALLGACALTGAYESDYVAAPYNFLAESLGAVSALLVPVALGFLVAVLTSLVRDDEIVALGGVEEPTAPGGLAILSEGEKS
jgi:hypothetical protein